MYIYNDGNRIYIDRNNPNMLDIIKKRVEYNIEKISLNSRLTNDSSKDIICNTEILLKTFLDDDEINVNIKNVIIDLPVKIS